MIKELLYLIVLVLGIPAGLILAKLCDDEIKKWKRRLVFISIVCVVLAAGLLLIDISYRIQILLTFIFIIITNLTIIWKSYNK